jgi:molybdopterin molybdotransferase
MLSVEAARERLVAAVTVTGSERVRLAEALGRVPAQPTVVAAHDVPPFANSAMDGFAIRSADGVAPRRLAGEVRAGGPLGAAVEPGTAVRIMTGAPLPEGADAVVPVEDATASDDVVTVRSMPAARAHVRDAGHDVRAGTAIALPAAPITASLIGLLAAMGEAEAEVRRRPRVAILSTGDELVPLGAQLGDGQIHDANGPALAAAVTEAGGEPLVLERAPDDPPVIERRLAEAAAHADIVIASGGVSVGEHDHVRTAIERLGELDFWRIAVQPGKPLAFGTVDGRPIVGLPGNPVSALVTFELFVRPMVRRMLGLEGDGRVRLRARAEDAMRKDPARRAYLRVRVCAAGDAYRAASAGGQASSQLLPLASANALLVVPEGVAETRLGELYEVVMLGPVE